MRNCEYDKTGICPLAEKAKDVFLCSTATDSPYTQLEPEADVLEELMAVEEYLQMPAED